MKSLLKEISYALDSTIRNNDPVVHNYLTLYMTFIAHVDDKKCIVSHGDSVFTIDTDSISKRRGYLVLEALSKRIDTCLDQAWARVKSAL